MLKNAAVSGAFAVRQTPLAGIALAAASSSADDVTNVDRCPVHCAGGIVDRLFNWPPLFGAIA
jgi:uncharacterized metal-binding protein